MRALPVKKGSLRRFLNSLFFVMFRNYGFIIVSFALLTGLIFLQLYSKASIEANEDQLVKQAVTISNRVAQFVSDDDYINYPSFLEVLEELETSDIWIISNPSNPMKDKYTNISFSAIDKPEFASLLEEVFSGMTVSMHRYSDTYGENYVFGAAPIKTAGGIVVGAVLVNQVAAAQKLVVSRSFTIIIISTLIALLISLILALLLTRQLSRPISEMRHTALLLADENYNAKTGISDEGEIGELAGAIDVLSDRLKSAAEYRASLDQMRHDFFANVSHELRTPITVIRAYTETLFDGIVQDEATKLQYYESILTECKSMQRLVGDLLVLSKLQNPDFVVEKEPINLVQVFEDVLGSGITIAKEKNIDIRFDCTSPVYLMYGDYDRIRQMFMVIIDNAIKFSDEGGTVSISIEEKDGLPETGKGASPLDTEIRLGTDVYLLNNKKLLITISDHGQGIKEEELPFIFDKFYKSKLRQNAKGSGLGLAIARQIALKHGGHVEVKSKLGEGTTFLFTFAELFEASAMK